LTFSNLLMSTFFTVTYYIGFSIKKTKCIGWVLVLHLKMFLSLQYFWIEKDKANENKLLYIFQGAFKKY